MVCMYYEDNWTKLYHADFRDILYLLPHSTIITDPPYDKGERYGLDIEGDYWQWMFDVLNYLRLYSKNLIMCHNMQSLKYLTNWDGLVIWYKVDAFDNRQSNVPLLSTFETVYLFGDFGVKVIGQDVIICPPEKARFFNPHPCPKPLYLFQRLIKLLVSDGEIIIDPFAGSGISLIAARMNGHKSIGIEFKEQYCEIIAQTLSSFNSTQRPSA